MSQVTPHLRCPACDGADMVRSGQTVNLATLLDRWEEVLGITFSSETRAKYTAPDCCFIILMTCPICRFGLFDPPVAGDREFYEAVETSSYYVGGKWEFQQAINDLRAFGARHVIDVGCGSGHFLRELRQAEPRMRLAANDLSPTQARQLATEGFDVYTGPPDAVVDASGQPACFDAVCTFQTLEHLSDPFDGLRKLRALIRPGGLLIVTTPDTAGPIQIYADSHTAVPPHHVTLWTERAFRAALPRYGFDVEVVRIEPLEHHLWDFYVAPQWDDNIWPAQVFGPLGRRTGHGHPDGQRQLAIDSLRRLGEKQLHGVRGHTVYVLARRVE